jgi:hypothetical protein
MPLKCDNQPVCDRQVVRACRDSMPAEELETCGDLFVCSGGRCMSPTCADAARNHTSFVGCFFYTARAENVASDAAQPTSFLVTNPGTDTAVVSLQHIEAGTSKWAFSTSISVPPGKSARLSTAGSPISNSGVTGGSAIRLHSDVPVTVAQIDGDDRDENALSSSGTMLLPLHVLGSHYLVLAYPQQTTPAIDATAGSSAGAARVLIVGTRGNTSLTFKASPHGAAIVGPEPTAIAAGETKRITLGEGDVFQASSAGDADDLTGSEITADLPVAVFSGNVSTAYGVVAPAGINSPDMTHEQLPPIARWSLKYVAAALPPQADTCDTLLGTKGASVWRMVAANPATEVTFAAARGVAGLPSSAITMDAGDVRELIVAGGDFSVQATGPLLLAQGMDCEPTLALAVSADKWHSDLSFAVLPNFDQLIAVVRPRGSPVMLDDEPIDGALFVSAGGNYEVARVQLPVCPPRDMVCVHRLSGQFGMTLRGMDVLAGYALTAPAWAGCIDQADPTCVP